MSKTKRICSLLLITVLAFALVLSGCTPIGTGTDGGGTTQTDGGETGQTGEAPVKLTWYLVGNRQEPDTPKVLEEANSYLKDKLNVTLICTYSVGVMITTRRLTQHCRRTYRYSIYCKLGGKLQCKCGFRLFQGTQRLPG